MVNKLPK